MKSRLRLGKDKIENRVLELEKKYGTKLYGLAPFTFFLALAKCQESHAAPNVWEGIENTIAVFQAEEGRVAAKAEEEKELAELKVLKESVDYEYLKNIFMAMLCYTDIDTVSDDTISTIINSTLLYKNIELEGVFGDAINSYPVWIEDDEVISFDTAAAALPVEKQFQNGNRYNNIVVKNTAYDKPFTILGYSKNWLDIYKADCAAALPVEKQFQNGNRYNNIVVKNTAYDKPFTILGYSKNWLDIYKADCEKKSYQYQGETAFRRFDEESFAIYTGGRGGGTEYEIEFLDTVTDEEKKCVRITFRYFANIMGRLTEEERMAEIIPADNPYGYVIQSITKVQEDEIPEINAENTPEESNEVDTENVQTEESLNSYAEELFGMLPENFCYDAQMGNYGVRLSVKDDGFRSRKSKSNYI